MRNINCDDDGCILEPMEYTQTGGGGNNITYISGEHDGLTPSEATYLIPLPRKGIAHLESNHQQRKKRKRNQTGGGRVNKPKRRQTKKRQPYKRRGSQAQRGQRKVKATKRPSTKKRWM